MPGTHGHRTVHLGQAINVGDLDAHLLDRANDFGRWSGARQHGVDRMIDSDFGRVGQVNQPIEHNRRPTQMADPMLMNQSEDFLRIDPTQEYMSPSQRSHRPWIAPAVAMKHRQGPQIHRVVPHGPSHLISQ
ncbi:hypothetical protein D9M73_222290 [compost metagenome]